MDRTVAPAAPGGWRGLWRLRTLWLVLAVEAIVAVLVVYGLWALRRQTLDDELRKLASLSAAMAAQADSTLGTADATLRATRAELAGGLLLPGTPDSHALLRARAAALPGFRALSVIDAQGLRLDTSRDEAPPRQPLLSRDFFTAARDAGGPALFVGTPYLSRLDGQPAIGVSMDWRDAQGRFQGVVVLAAEPDFLDGGFERIAPTPDTSLAIYRQDGALVSNGPGDGRARLLPAAAMARLWADPSPETPRLLNLPGGDQRLVAAHRLARFPLWVVVTRDGQAALADWLEQAWLVGSFAASALLVTAVLSLRNAREQALRQASEAALAAEQARAVRAFQAAEEGHWEWDPVSRHSHLSPRMKELLGLPRDAPAPTGEPLTAQAPLHPDDVAPLRSAFADHLADHQAGHSPAFDSTFRVRQADGGWRHVRVRGQAWPGGDGRPALFSGTAVDVTAEVEADAQRRRLEEQLQRARKLEALGTLAGGVAHDFNNILAAVIGYGELARDAAAAGTPQARQLDQVLQAGQRGKALVERILSFSRSTPRPHSRFALQPVVDEVLQLLAASLPVRVQLVRQLQAPAAVVAGDATMVFEAAMNLCTNALQAMPDGGTLTVALDEVRLTEPLPMFEQVLPAGAYARLVVTDGGPGIAPAVMARLFEPFFTTKGPRNGTGLGLAVVHGVMADLRGGIDVRSTPGQGASFALYFPCSDGPATPVDAAPLLAPPGQGQVVLVVDDEPGLVALAEELLAGLGYEPVGFASSAQALAAFSRAPDRFDLLLTDEVMPELTGTALAAAVHALRPGLPVVLASGFGGPQLATRAAEAGVAIVLKKPLVRAELAQAIDRALHGTPGVANRAPGYS